MYSGSVDFGKIRYRVIEPSELLVLFVGLRHRRLLYLLRNDSSFRLSPSEYVVAFIDDDAAKPLKQPVACPQKKPTLPSL